MHGYTYIPQIQALAGGGYCVVIINPRGSNGYGQAFSSGCVGDWGGGDYRDLMAGLGWERLAAAETKSILDDFPNRVGASS